MSSIFQALTAILFGARLCLFDPEIRRLAFWPWLIGAAVYPFTFFVAWFSYDPLLHWIAATPVTLWGSIWYYAVKIILALVLLGISLGTSLVLILACTSVFQNSIAAAVLIREGNAPPESSTGLSGGLKEAGRTVAVESAKLLWLIPLTLLSLLLYLIPILSPLALLLGAWLLAYQFVDVVLDTLRIGVWERLRFGRTHTPLLILFGISLMPLWAIPLLGVFLAPMATAGASRLLARSGSLKAIAQREKS